MEKVITEKQLTVVTRNVPGTLATVTGVVADQGVNIENVCAFAVGEEAIFHLLTNDSEQARAALEQNGYQVTETEVILMQLWNRPGFLSAVAMQFRKHALNLQYVYGTSSPDGEKMTIVFSSDNNKAASEIFDAMVLEEAEQTI
jgi:hypothetical protein